MKAVRTAATALCEPPKVRASWRPHWSWRTSAATPEAKAEAARRTVADGWEWFRTAGVYPARVGDITELNRRHRKVETQRAQRTTKGPQSAADLTPGPITSGM